MMNKILRIGSIIIILTTLFLAARSQYLFMNKPQEPQKIEVEQVALYNQAEAFKEPEFVIKINKCCPVCGSKNRMTYNHSITGEKREDFIQIDDRDFVICADCGNVYIEINEVK